MTDPLNARGALNEEEPRSRAIWSSEESVFGRRSFYALQISQNLKKAENFALAFGIFMENIFRVGKKIALDMGECP